MGAGVCAPVGEIATEVGGAVRLPMRVAIVVILVLRKDRVGADHFRVWAVIPALAIASCVLLLYEQTAGTWGRAALLLGVGVLLHLLAQAPWWGSSEEPEHEEQVPTAS